jgi:myosin-crossreactive antigen
MKKITKKSASPRKTKKPNQYKKFIIPIKEYFKIHIFEIAFLLGVSVGVVFPQASHSIFYMAIGYGIGTMSVPMLTYLIKKLA